MKQDFCDLQMPAGWDTINCQIPGPRTYRVSNAWGLGGGGGGGGKLADGTDSYITACNTNDPAFFKT